MGRILYISMIGILGITFILCTWFLYIAYKKIEVGGKRLIEKPMNENIRTDKMGIGELIVYVFMFVIAILFSIQILYGGAKFPSATAILIRSVILIPIMAVFNARKRTGKAIVALFASLLFVLFCTITYISIGLPVKAPILSVNDIEIIMGRTTVRELMGAGFDIYMEKEPAAALDMKEFPKSEVFEKYSEDMDIIVPKGYHWQSSEITPYSKGILAQNDGLIAEVIFYGSMKEETELKDCSIIYFITQKRYIPEERKKEISIKLNGVELIEKIEPTIMKEKFGRKIFRPSSMETDRHCIISWSSRSDHLFYNSYAAVIEMDDNYSSESIEMECQIARESE